jgi:antitoxin HicB
MANMSDLSYPIIVTPLSEEDGGGFAAYVPDLQGCMADGATEAEAIACAHNAILEWIDEAKECGLPIPAPLSGGARFQKRLRSLERIVELQDQMIDAYDEQLSSLKADLEALQDANAGGWLPTTVSFTAIAFSRKNEVEVH